MLTSHPFALLLSQLAKPALQAPMTHVPLAHDSAAFAKSHVTPHPPQCESVVSDCSQPFALLPSQLPKPLLHVVIVQVPLTHAAPALAKAHTFPQPPQLFTSVLVLTSQPSPVVLLQLA